MAEITTNFLDIMEGKPQPTLKAIAEVFGVPQQRLYSVAKQPKAGEVYDARVYNWDAISRFIAKRIGHEGDAFQTMEEVYDAAMLKDEELAASDKRRTPRGTAKALIDLGNGKQMPARRKEVAIGDTLYLKKHSETFEVVYFTETHVILRVADSPVLTCLSNWTFNQNISDAPAAVEAPADADAEG